ncbi:MAG: hypothetical protein E4H40_03345 [Candidatus Brocadiia bacterium]|nr:MAG: hypothetical protein E4H40_03345 [Candidatus Brocadiia bacterium]
MAYTAKIVSCLIGLAILLSGQGCHFVSCEQCLIKSDYRWQETDSTIALLNSEKIVWQLNHGKQQGQPYFHPLSSNDGTELTALRPKDHPWHRGLWFSWKYINGVNYWDPEIPPGQTDVINFESRLNKDYSAEIEMSISYHPPQESAVLTEKRFIAAAAPDKNGCYYIDWFTIFTAGDNNVLLDRTALPGEKGGKSYGGYGGLSLRMAEYTKSWHFVGSEGPLEPESRGSYARWVDFSGKIANGQTAGVTIFDYPENPSHPSSWWLSGSMPFFSPAVLIHKPLTLSAGQSLTLRYRIYVHTGASNKATLENIWKGLLATRDPAIAKSPPHLEKIP